MSLTEAIEAAIIAIAGKAVEAALSSGKDDALADAEFEAQLEAHRIANEHQADYELYAKWKLQQKVGGQ